MTIYKRTEQMVITTNMTVNKECIADRLFKIEDVIEHLTNNEDQIVKFDPIAMETLDVCIQTLEEHRDEVIAFDEWSIHSNPNLTPKTFVYPTGRIIRVELTERPKAVYGDARRLSERHLTNGYDMAPSTWAHTALIIKIEKMTNVSCFATWTLVS